MASRPQHALRFAEATDTNAARNVLARPKALRDAKAVIARAHHEGMERAARKQEQLAFDLEVPRATVSRWGNARETHAPNATNLARDTAPREYVRCMLSAIADVHHLHVSDATTVKHGDNHALRTLHVTTETTDVMRAWAAALADNHLSDAELADIQREVREAIDALRESDAYVTAEIGRRAKQRYGG